MKSPDYGTSLADSQIRADQANETSQTKLESSIHSVSNQNTQSYFGQSRNTLFQTENRGQVSESQISGQSGSNRNVTYPITSAYDERNVYQSQSRAYPSEASGNQQMYQSAAQQGYQQGYQQGSQSSLSQSRASQSGNLVQSGYQGQAQSGYQSQGQSGYQRQSGYQGQVTQSIYQGQGQGQNLQSGMQSSQFTQQSSYQPLQYSQGGYSSSGRTVYQSQSQGQGQSQGQNQGQNQGPK